MILLMMKCSKSLMEGSMVVTEEKIEIIDEQDIVQVRQRVREVARIAGFSSANQTRLATAILELMRNVINFTTKGLCTINTESYNEMEKVIVAIEDHGHGIPDIKKTMAFNFKTKTDSLGVGLSNVKRLVNEFNIKSIPGYTKFTIVMFQEKESINDL